MTTKLPTKKMKPAAELSDYIVLIFGPPGIGKTTWMVGIDPDVLIISTDRGTRYLTRYAVEVHTWKDFIDVIKELEKSPKKRKQYGLIGIDHIDDIYNMCEDYICKKLGIDALGDAGYGKGWKMVRVEFRKAFQRILKMQKGIICVAHEIVKTIKGRTIETDRTVPDLNKTGWKVIIPVCDVVAYAGYRRVRKGKKRVEERILITEPREDLYVKDRTGRCPPIMVLNGQRFFKAFMKGTSNGKEENENENEGKNKRGRREKAKKEKPSKENVKQKRGKKHSQRTKGA